MQKDLSCLVAGTFPNFHGFDSASLAPFVRNMLRHNATVVAQLVASSEDPTWDNFMAPLSEVDQILSKVWSMASHLHAVCCNDDLRSAYEASLPLISQYYTELAQNTALFHKIETFANSTTFDALDTAQKKIINNALRDFKLSGVHLPDADKKTLQAYQQKLSALTMQFEQNVMDATDHFTYFVDNAERLTGLPEMVKARAKTRAEAEGKTGWLFGLDAPTAMAILTLADDRALRRVFYQAYTTRASDIGENSTWDNSQVMVDIQQIKQKIANVLGFKHYAERSLVTKMAPDVDSVMQFLSELGMAAKSQAEAEYNALKDYAKTRDAIDLCPWDNAYYSEKLKQEQFCYASEDYRAYFPFAQVMQGLFDIVKRVFGLQIAQMKSVPVWHDDVCCYSVHDHHNTLRGYFYVDLYARPKKRGGAWMDDYCSRSKSSTGIVESPIAYLNCNFTPPVGDLPALLTHDEVVTVFHEFGHTLHHILTQVDYADVAGINGVMWDAVEFPSQFLEHWCYTPEGLAILAKHYKTHAVLPEDMQHQLIASRCFQGAMQMMRQIEFSVFDMRLYSDVSMQNSADVQACLDAVRSEYSVVKTPVDNRFQHSFSHIFAGGYAAGYYSYKWAEIMASDAFTQFEQQGVFNRPLGQKYMACILEQGGVYDADVLFENFMGRPPQIDALLRHNGISTL